MKLMPGGGAQPTGRLGLDLYWTHVPASAGGGGGWHVTETIPCPQAPGTAAWAEPFEKAVLSVHRVKRAGCRCGEMEDQRVELNPGHGSSFTRS